MKTLKNHLILFDGDCPMCQAYTHAFVATGMLDTTGRAAYQNGIDNVCPLIDKQRAVNEIALVDTISGEVTYGVQSIFKILGNAWPVFRPLFQFKPFGWLMSKVYAFISYNRRVIIPANEGEHFEWQPTFKLHYRIAYLLFSWFCVGYILTAYARLLSPAVPLGGLYREYLICGGQIVFQGIVLLLIDRKKLWNYLGNMMTISLAGSLLLLLPLGAAHLFKLAPVDAISCFIVVAGLMFLEHIRRTRLLKLGWLPTITWALYRIILLLLILS